MVAARRQGPRSTVRLISKSTGVGDADQVMCKAMATIRTTGRVKTIRNARGSFCKDQNDWGGCEAGP